MILKRLKGVLLSAIKLTRPVFDQFKEQLIRLARRIMRRIFNIACGIVLVGTLHTSCSNQPKSVSNDCLWPIQVNESWGYIDGHGKIVVPCKYDEAVEFSEGRGAVRKGSKWGFVNGDGKIVVDVKFDDVYPRFSNGLTRVNDARGNRYIDLNGKTAFECDPAWSRTGEFHDSLATCQVGQKWGYLNRSGAIAIQPQYDRADESICGRAKVDFNGRTVFIDRSGRTIFEPQCDLETRHHQAMSFRENLCRIRKNGKYGFIDTLGSVVILPELEMADAFYEGLCAVKFTGKWGFIDCKGKVAINPLYKRVSYFREGLCGVETETGYGYINTSGEIIIQPAFSSGHAFQFGVARVEQNDYWGYIDRNGRWLWKNIG